MDGGRERQERIVAMPRVIVSYDVQRGRGGSIVYQFVHGRTVTVHAAGRLKRYRYPGLVDREGVIRLGQSVLMMREDDAEDLMSFLRKSNVSYTTERVWVRV